MMTRVFFVLLLAGCTQVATTREPLSVACEVRCTPGSECVGKFVGTGEVSIDSSTLAVPVKDEVME